MVFSGYTPSSGIAGSYGKSIFVHLFFAFNERQFDNLVFGVCIADLYKALLVYFMYIYTPISCSGVSHKQSNSTESKAVLTWRDLRTKLEEAQIEQVKPQQVVSITELKLTDDILPRNSDKIFTNPSALVFLKSGTPSTSIGITHRACLKCIFLAEARRTTILQPVEQKPHSEKDRQDGKAEGYVPDEGTR